MSPRHHPSHERIFAAAVGGLEADPTLVIDTHLGVCAACREESVLVERVGGALLEDMPPVGMSPDALARALARVERPTRSGQASSPPPQRPDWIEAPSAVLEAAWRRRRWAAPGVWVAPVARRSDGARSYILRVGAGMRMPRHSHRGIEMTCVLKGAYRDGDDIHGPGDFAETDGGVEHAPVITRDGECVSLVFADGPLLARDWMGRLFQPLVRI